jgi:hypothetical protein
MRMPCRFADMKSWKVSERALQFLGSRDEWQSPGDGFCVAGDLRRIAPLQVD